MSKTRIGVSVKRKLFFLGIFLMVIAVVMLWYPNLFHHSTPQKKWILVNETKLGALLESNKQLELEISSNPYTQQPVIEGTIELNTNGDDDWLTKGYDISPIVGYHSNNMEDINHPSNPVEPTNKLKYVFNGFGRLSSAGTVYNNVLPTTLLTDPTKVSSASNDRNSVLPTTLLTDPTNLSSASIIVHNPVLPTSLLIDPTKFTQSASFNSISKGNITQVLNVSIVTNTAIRQHSTIDNSALPINMSHFEHFNGTNNDVNGTNDVVNGTNDVVNGTNDVVNGTNDVVNGTNDVVNGTNDVVNGTNDVVNGTNDVVNGTNDVVNGTNDVVNGTNDVVNGTNDVVNGTNDVVDGINNVVNGTNDVVNGTNNVVNVFSGTDNEFNGTDDDFNGTSDVFSGTNDKLNGIDNEFNGTNDVFKGTYNVSISLNSVESSNDISSLDSMSDTTESPVATIPLESINQSNTNTFETIGNVSVSSTDIPSISSASSDMYTMPFENETPSLSVTNDEGVVSAENETSALQMTDATFSQPSDDTWRENVDGDGDFLDKNMGDFHDVPTTSQPDVVTSQPKTDEWENQLSEILNEIQLSSMRNSERLNPETDAPVKDEQNRESNEDYIEEQK